MAQRQSLQGGRFARWHQETSPPVEEDSWLITYLDVMTLLLVMMVVMLAFSEPASKTPKAAALAKPDAALPAPLGASAPGVAASGPIPGAPHLVAGGSIVAPLRPPTSAFEHLPLDRLGSQVEVIKSESSVRFRISSELLFAPGEAGLTPGGLRLLDTLLPTFNLAIDRHIVVEGHTDDTPINTARFPSNWELAAGRAGSVVRHLQSRGLNPTRLRATGYAETRPIESNRTPQGQQANRRVELILELPRNDG
jgi:chemotaxis protein MotB